MFTEISFLEAALLSAVLPTETATKMEDLGRTTWAVTCVSYKYHLNSQSNPEFKVRMLLS